MALLVLLAFATPGSRADTEPRLKKVLPHFLDEAGRHTLAPSLFERDAYQAELRRHPERARGMRFHVLWAAGSSSGREFILRLEARPGKSALGTPLTVERRVSALRRGGRWTSVDLDDAAWRAAGGVAAWRVSIWDGDRMVAEQKSFLW